MTQTKVLLCLFALLGAIGISSCDGGSSGTSPDSSVPTDSFSPLVRFAVTSDVHLDTGATRQTKLGGSIDYAYQFAAGSETGYNTLDAFLVVGDLPNHGSREEFQLAKDAFDAHIRTDETKLIVMNGNHDTWNKTESCADLIREMFNQEPDAYNKINGFPFVSISPSNDNQYFSTKQTWLSSQMGKAQRECPGKPVLMFAHHPAYNTVIGTDLGAGWGTGDLEDAIDGIEGLVRFSGHTHCSIMDPRSIHQDKYTTINTGVMLSYEMPINGYDRVGVYPSDKKGNWTTTGTWVGTTAEMWIVEINADNDMRLFGYNHEIGKIVVERYLKDVTKKENYVSEATKKEQEPLPVFPSGSEMKMVVKERTRALVQFPKAVSEGYIETYRIRLYQDHSIVDEKILLGCQYFNPEPSTFSVQFTDLEPGTEYTVKAYAVNAYNKISKSHVDLTFTTAAL